MLSRKTLLNPKFAGFATFVLLVAVGLALLHLNSRLGLTLRFASYDWAYDLSCFQPKTTAAGEITMVYLDEASTIDFQQPFNRPWDRAIHARLLDRLSADGARAVVFDIVFSDPGPDAATDQQLAEAIRRNGRVILAADYSENQPSSNHRARARETTLTPPYQPFAAAAAGWGIAQLQPDEDFLVREHNHGPADTDYVSLAWATARLLRLPVTANDQNRFRERWINYYNGPANFEGLSYKLAFSKPAGFFRDKVVFIGGRPQTGLLRERKDQFRSPYTTWYSNPVFTPAVDVHATTLLNLMRGDWLRKLPTAAEWALVLLAALIFGPALMRFRPSAAVGVTALGALAFTLTALVGFGVGRVWFPWLVHVIVMAPLGLMAMITFKSLDWYVVRRGMEQQREQAHQQIREQATLLDKAQDAIIVHDLAGRSTYWNPSAERLYGWTATEAREKSIVELLCPNDGLHLAQAQEAVLKDGEWAGQLRQTTKDGRQVLVESRWTRVNDETGRPKSILVLTTDITERSKLEAQLLRTQRMESIGTLAGGIAHDLNNVLTPIIMGAELIEMREQDPGKQKILRNISSSAKRGADMVKQVLTFARGQEGEKAPLTLKHIIQEMEKIARETFPKSIELRTDVAQDLQCIEGDATQMHQVLLNFCVNARDAMPDGGRILIEAGNVVLDEAAAKGILGARPGPYVRLRVSDTGTGIPQEIIERIFEPFFTTKGVGKGTGLGLSTVLSIVKSHGGLIDVTSVSGKGTTFTILFPASGATAVVEMVGGPKPAAFGTGQQVLVVDDEPLIREIIGSVLADQGYRVLEAEDGARGVALFEQHSADISLVVTDMMMPVLDGKKAIEAMWRIRPDMRFISISGLGQSGDFEQGPHAPRVEILRKPFTAEKILETVARAVA